jgi:drug/metabolite transporter (DMT)-like permease
MNIGYLYALGSAIAWGLIYVINQKMLVHNSPLAVMFMQSLITAIIALPVYALSLKFSGESTAQILFVNKTNILYFLSIAALTALSLFLIFSSIKLIGVSSASVIEISYPFFIVVFSYLFFRSTINAYFLLGTLLIFIGSAIIIKFSN